MGPVAALLTLTLLSSTGLLLGSLLTPLVWGFVPTSDHETILTPLRMLLPASPLILLMVVASQANRQAHAQAALIFGAPLVMLGLALLLNRVNVELGDADLRPVETTVVDKRWYKTKGNPVHFIQMDPASFGVTGVVEVRVDAKQFKQLQQ